MKSIPEYALTTTMQTFSTKVSQDGSFDMQINTSNNIQYERIMIRKPQTMTIGSSKYATFCSPEAIDISHQTNFDAYYASSYNSGTGVLTMTKITDGIIPANTGVMLYGTSGTFYYTTETGSTDFSSNLLHPVLSDAQQVAETYGDNTAYVLGNQSGIGFYRTTARTNMGGKAYLLLPTTTSAPRITFNFGDYNVTGINTVKGAELKDNGYFDLQGRKVAQPTKGLYIVNGKKVVVK